VNNNNYLIPANTKSGALFLNIFNTFDLILFISGVIITVILLSVLPIETLPITLIALSPALVCSFLVLPIPNYHNVLTLINSALSFLTERRNFIWKGWCIYDGEASKK
jgi:hypothetical protein